MAFHPSGQIVAIGQGSYKQSDIRLWDIRTGNITSPKEAHEKNSPNSEVISLDFSPDGKLLAGGFTDFKIKVWDAESRKLRFTFDTSENWGAFHLAFSPDSQTLASAHFKNALRVWDVTTGKEKWSQFAHSGMVNALAYSRDGQTLVTGGEDGAIRIWNAATGDELFDKELSTKSKHNSAITSLGFSADGLTMASTDRDSKFLLWDTVNYYVREEFVDEVGTRICGVIAFSPDGRTLAGATCDSEIKLWNLKGKEKTSTLSGRGSGVTAVAFDPLGRTLATANYKGRIQLWYPSSGKPPVPLSEHNGSVLSLAYSHDGKLIASGGYDQKIILWDAASGRFLKVLVENERPIENLAFSPDDKSLASVDEPRLTDPQEYAEVRTWDVEKGTLKCPIGKVYRGVHSLCFSRDGGLIAVATSPGYGKIWDASTGTELYSFKGDASSIAFSPDGKTLATAKSSQIKLWNINYDSKQLWISEGNSFAVNTNGLASLAFSHDGKLLASCEDDNSVSIWRVSDYYRLQRFEGHSDSVVSLSFDKENKVLATGSWDGSTRLWRVNRDAKGTTGKELCALFVFIPRMWFNSASTWVVTNPYGRFDTNNLEDMDGLHWTTSDEPLKPLPLEIFIQDFYTPRLLAESIKEKRAGTDDLLPRDLSTLNLQLPEVKLIEVGPEVRGSVNVTVVVAGSKGKTVHNGNVIEQTSGVFDLRLFRDRQLIGSSTQIDNARANSKARLVTNEDRLQAWREATRLTSGTDTVVVQFPNIRLPRGTKSASGAVEFSAYAFNSDKVKGSTFRQKVDAAESADSKPGKAYLICIGVGDNENSNFSLGLVANDARWIGQTFYEYMNCTNQFSEIVTVPMVSDITRDTEKEVLPTGDNIHTVLDLLSGRYVEPRLLNMLPEAIRKRLKRAEPEDLVVISFFGHGYLNNREAFYLLPYDVGTSTGVEITPAILEHAISSDDLAAWMRDIDAGRIYMILGACYSAKAIASGDFKAGPMANSGLGQLAYDKRMRILTAANDISHGDARKGHSLLAQAIIKDGLLQQMASGENLATLKQLLEFGTEQVPKLSAEWHLAGSADQQQPIIFDFVEFKKNVDSASAEPDVILANRCKTAEK